MELAIIVSIQDLESKIVFLDLLTGDEPIKFT